MTAGTQLIDMRIAFADACASTSYAGLAARRVWSGTDRTAPKRPRRVLHEAFESSQLRPDGKPFIIPAYYVRDAASPPFHEEHPYSCTYLREPGCKFLFAGSFICGVGNYGATFGAQTELYYASPWTANDDINLINRLRSKLVGSFDPAPFLAQFGQTFTMVTSSAVRIATSAKYLKRGRVKDAAAVLTRGTTTKVRSHHRNYSAPLSPKDLASAQLELSYGWLPLLSDAHQGAEYLAQNLGMPRRTSVRVTLNKDVPLGTSSPAIWKHTGVRSKYRAALIARLSENMSPLYLAGLDDPLSMAWEVLPWSFVADWFIPIQNFLQARSFAQNTAGTYIKTVGFDITSSGLKSLSGSYQLQGSYSAKKRTIDRTILSSLAVKLPVFQPLSSVPSYRRCLNAVSLLVQRHGSSAA